MRIVAFDSKKILRHNIEKKDQPNFKALLGVGVTITNYDHFISEYNKTFDSLFKENDFQRNKIIYKSSDLKSIFYGVGVDAISFIVQKLLPHITFIDIYYSYFLSDSAKMQGEFKVGVYGREKAEQLTAPEFLDLIEGHYPSICCHAHIKSISTPIKSTYFIDDCPGLRPSIAVENIMKNNSAKFLFRGDQVNYAISIADILCGYIDSECLRNGFNLNKDMISNLRFNQQKAQTTFIGPSWLNDIKPYKNVNLHTSHKFPHPIFFFFTGPEGPFGKDSKDILEKSRLFSLALDKASELSGCVKFFESPDQNYITEKDFLIAHNSVSEEKINELIKLACKAKKIDASFFNK